MSNILQEGREFTSTEFAAQNDRVVVTGHYEWSVKATGRNSAATGATSSTSVRAKSRVREFTGTYRAALVYQAPALVMKGSARPDAGRPGAH